MQAVTRRVVITGAGTINALGLDVVSTQAAMADGRCAIGPLDIPDLDRLSIRIGAQVTGFDPEAHVPRNRLAMLDRATIFALAAAAEAVNRSGLDVAALGDRAGVVLGCSGGGFTSQDAAYRATYAEGRDRVHPFTVPKVMNSAPTAQLSMAHGVRGPAFTVSSACASSNHAIAQAVLAIRSGMADAMLTGGTEAMLCFGGIKAWEGLRVMSRDTCRPFCATRSGMVQGEGAAVFVLESRDGALARGAPILAEIAGVAMCADAADIVLPAAEGAARAMRGALRDGDLAPDRIGYVNAHGTGTAANDRVEAQAIREVFGADVPMVSSTKSMHGHCIGATGGLELLACLMALGDGIIAPTVNFREADPDCPLDVVPNTARRARVDACLSNAFAFGGMNAVLALTAA